MSREVREPADKHKRHGTNVQVLADPFGRLLWTSAALPGAVHHVKSARTRGVMAALTEAGVRCWADKGESGRPQHRARPYRGRWETLSEGQKAVKVSPARIRAVCEQAMATLKSWRLLRKLRCSATRITDPVKAVLALHIATSS